MEEIKSKITFKKDMTNDFFNWYIDDGFGARPKKEIDIKLFNFMYQNFFKDYNNYSIAKILRITEQKVKSLISESEAKFQSISHREALEFVFNKIVNHQNNIELDKNGNIFLNIENPKIKSEFSYAAKKVGYFTDFTFNDEILKFKPHVFISILLNMNKELKELTLDKIKENIKEQSLKESIMDKTLPLNKKIEKTIGQHKEKFGLLLEVIKLAEPFNLFRKIL